jgi:hypothetical protein
LTAIGVISQANEPSLLAFCARCSEAMANSSWDLPGKGKLRRAILGERAHQAAFVVRVLEAVVEHVVDHLAVAHAQAGARLWQEIRRVGHRLHAAGHDHDVFVAEDVVGEHRRLHPRAAHLVHGRAARRERQARAERRLTRRRLALAGGQDAAHQHFAHVFGTDLRALDGGANRRRAELRSGEAF